MATATDAEGAHLKVVRGTVLIQESRRLDWVAASDGMGLDEGYRIRTDDTSQALVTLFEGTQLSLFPGSEVTVSSLRRLRFDPNSFSVAVGYRKGKLRIDIGDGTGSRRDFRVTVPDAGAEMILAEGSYSLDSNSRATEIKVRDGGVALVKGLDKSVEVKTGQMTNLTSGQPPTAPAAAARELAANGRFQDGLARWSWDNRDVSPKSQLGKAEIVSTDIGNAVRFIRTDSNSSHGETYIHQDINQDVSDFRSLQLFLQLKLESQSLSGGGYMGSEYPLMVRINYRSERGDNVMVYGFYSQNEAENLTTNGTLLPQGEWVSYKVPDNLMTVEPAPTRILSLEVTASGHDYESLLKEISLEGE